MKTPKAWLISVIPVSLVIYGCYDPYFLQKRTAKAYTTDSTLSPDTSFTTSAISDMPGADTTMQTVIGHTDIPLTKAQPECTLGNFIADAQLAAAKKVDNNVVGSVVNYGGIRLSYIAPGVLTKETMHELMPFDNRLTIVEMPGSVLKRFCSHMARRKGWPVSGISYIIKENEAINVMINGTPVNDHIVYRMVMSDYLARGGNSCDFLVPLKKRYTGVLVRNAMIEYVINLEKEGKPLHPQLEKRVQYAE